MHLGPRSLRPMPLRSPGTPWAPRAPLGPHAMEKNHLKIKIIIYDKKYACYKFAGFFFIFLNLATVSLNYIVKITFRSTFSKFLRFHIPHGPPTWGPICIPPGKNARLCRAFFFLPPIDLGAHEPPLGPHNAYQNAKTAKKCATWPHIF